MKLKSQKRIFSEQDSDTSKVSPPFLMADTHCVMSGVVTECLIRTGRETISLSWTAVVSVARRSVWSIGRPQGARVTRFKS